MTRVRQVTAAEFSREVFFSPVPVVVDVFAEWCGPCRAIAPVLEDLAELHEGKIQFLKVNIDEQPEIAETFGVEAVPTLLFFQNGQLIDRVAGIPPLEALLAQLDGLAGRTNQTAVR